MENRRCLHCGRKIHPALRPDAKYCGRSCKSSYHRDKKQREDAAKAELAGPRQAANSSLASMVQKAAPPGATGYLLRRQGCPLGNGNFEFPVPYRKTKHADGTLRDTTVYQLWPFEPPRVPWTGFYELLFFVSASGMVLSDDPEMHGIHIGKSDVVPRAAFDEHSLWNWVPPGDGSDAGSTESVHRQVLACAPAEAIGYILHASSPSNGLGSITFPPPERLSRRANGGISNVPYYTLKPFELPCVPWAGTYTIVFELEHGIIRVNSDPELRQIRVGFIFPHADYDKPGEATPAPKMLRRAGRPQLLLNGASSPRRVLRRLRPVRR